MDPIFKFFLLPPSCKLQEGGVKLSIGASQHPNPSFRRRLEPRLPASRHYRSQKGHGAFDNNPNDNVRECTIRFHTCPLWLPLTLPVALFTLAEIEQL